MKETASSAWAALSMLGNMMPEAPRSSAHLHQTRSDMGRRTTGTAGKAAAACNCGSKVAGLPGACSTSSNIQSYPAPATISPQMEEARLHQTPYTVSRFCTRERIYFIPCLLPTRVGA